MSEKSSNPDAYLAKHKTAFRIAFDFLNSHFPPGESTDWWEQTAKDAEYAHVVTADREPLATELLLGVYNYLEKEWKKRYGQTEG